MTTSSADFTDPEATRIVDVGGPREVEAVVEQLDRFGFAVLKPAPFPEDVAPLEALAGWLGLGEPYVPLLYRKRTDETSSAYADIMPRVESDHPSFGTSHAQPLHVDGLLDPMGTIRTSMLYCVRPAAEGGRTILFNSPAVFLALMETDPDAAKVLLQEEVLERYPTIPGAHGGRRAPAFAFDDDGELMTRFSDGLTERWHPPQGEEDTLDRALLFFRGAFKAPRYALPVMLGTGQCLLMRNDRLSHAREDFVSEPGKPRHLVRGLYTEVPGQVPAVSAR